MENQKNKSTPIVHYNLRKNKLKFLYNSKANNTDRIKLISPKKFDNKYQKISSLEDGMFKCLFFNEKRKKYSAKLISLLLDVPYKTVLKRLNFDKNALDKEKKKNKNSSVDYLAYIDDCYINIECNNSDKEKYMKRNTLYAFNIASRKNKEGVDDIEGTRIQVYQICINNFAKADEKRTIVYSPISPKRGLVRTDNIIFIDIYLPNIVNKWYNLGIEKLNYIERLLLVYTLYNIDECRKIGRGDKFMNEFIDDAIKASNDENVLSSYNKQWEMNDYFKEEGREEGIEQGIEQGMEQGIEKGIEQNKIETAKKLYKSNVSIDIIKKVTGFTTKQIKNICL